MNRRTTEQKQEEIRNFIKTLPWHDNPWHSGSHTSHLVIFLDTNMNIDKKEISIRHIASDLENINAHLYSIEALMERIFDVKVPEEVENIFREVAGEIAPDPLNIDRLRLNRLLHQTPDLPDK